MNCQSCGREFDTFDVRYSLGPLILEVQSYSYDPRRKGGDRIQMNERVGDVPGALCDACARDFPREAAVMLQLALKERWRK